MKFAVKWEWVLIVVLCGTTVVFAVLYGLERKNSDGLKKIDLN